jgi:hypothetical protein
MFDTIFLIVVTLFLLWAWTRPREQLTGQRQDYELAKIMNTTVPRKINLPIVQLEGLDNPSQEPVSDRLMFRTPSKYSDDELFALSMMRTHSPEEDTMTSLELEDIYNSQIAANTDSIDDVIWRKQKNTGVMAYKGSRIVVAEDYDYTDEEPWWTT